MKRCLLVWDVWLAITLAVIEAESTLFYTRRDLYIDLVGGGNRDTRPATDTRVHSWFCSWSVRAAAAQLFPLQRVPQSKALAAIIGASSQVHSHHVIFRYASPPPPTSPGNLLPTISSDKYASSFPGRYLCMVVWTVLW